MKDFIKNEIIHSNRWTEKILSSFPKELWEISPKGFKTNMNWQVGHVIISTYFHSILCISGSDEEIKESFSPREYSTLYGMGSNALADLDTKPTASTMLDNLALLDQRSLDILDSLNVEDLDEKTLLRNPVAKTKKDALVWTFKHRMWHTGQMALIKSHF